MYTHFSNAHFVCKIYMQLLWNCSNIQQFSCDNAFDFSKNITGAYSRDAKLANVFGCFLTWKGMKHCYGFSKIMNKSFSLLFCSRHVQDITDVPRHKFSPWNWSGNLFGIASVWASAEKLAPTNAERHLAKYKF